MDRATRATHFWVFCSSGKPNKVPLELLADKHLINTHHFLRRKKADADLLLDRLGEHLSLSEIAQKIEELRWCERWISRFAKQIEKKKLKERSLSVSLGTTQRKREVNTLEIRRKTREDKDLLVLMKDNTK